MKILLQDKNTLNYIRQDGGWTLRHNQARAFTTGLEAILFCWNHDRYHMQILGEFPDARMNFAAPITDDRMA